MSHKSRLNKVVGRALAKAIANRFLPVKCATYWLCNDGGGKIHVFSKEGKELFFMTKRKS